MKKILLACDGDNFPKGSMEFVKALYNEERVLVIGAFMKAVNFAEYLPGVFAVSAFAAEAFLDVAQQKQETSIQAFEKACIANGIEYRVHRSSMDWNLGDLIKETRFADLLIIGEETFCAGVDSSQPNGFMKETIHRSECPVICIPEKYNGFHKLVFAYNGSSESMFALRQFCGLFPSASSLEMKIVYASETGKEIPDLDYLEEYAGAHFPNLDFEKLPFNGRRFLETWLTGKSGVLLISGSFGRSGFSTSIRPSFVDEILHEHLHPVFIAHN